MAARAVPCEKASTASKGSLVSMYASSWESARDMPGADCIS